MGCDFINNRASTALPKAKPQNRNRSTHQIHITQESSPRVKVPVCKRRCKIHVQLKARCMEGHEEKRNNGHSTRRAAFLVSSCKRGQTNSLSGFYICKSTIINMP
ncbi:uncharacterized protein LOC115732386 [Rhodamnia argentea]|uniref:Uncharacterized protein LOC115732386 n=1 Tax=Rhodamnia argentea TaxID=178133 RepID=A0ABM3HH18_9MYRT|nr:uncharacterized protein LOC115732386 [Rhodamnia argentea]